MRGTGQGAIENMLQARAQGPFQDLFDFCSRVDKRVVNRRVLEALIRAGAFDSIDSQRARLLASAGRAFEAMMPMKKIDVATIEAARRG